MLSKSSEDKHKDIQEKDKDSVSSWYGKISLKVQIYSCAISKKPDSIYFHFKSKIYSK